MNKPAGIQKIPLGLIALTCLLALGTEMAEYEFFRHLITERKKTSFNQLSSIGQLKASQLAAFLKERRGDSLLLTDLFPVGLTQRWWKTPDSSLPIPLQQPLESAISYYGYAGAAIFDAKGNIRFRTGRSMDLSAQTLAFIRHVLETAPAPFSEIYAADPTAPEQPVLDTFAPIKDTQPGATLGVLMLRGNWPELFSLIQSWPVESHTAETLLFTYDQARVVVINKLRHEPQGGVKPFTPIAVDPASPLPIIKTAQGQYGPIDTVDYRGQSVLAHSLLVPGTPWSLVVKIDTKEVLAHLHYLQWIIAVLTLLGTTGIGFWAYTWQRRQTEAHARHEMQQVELRLAAVIDSATDAIISIDEAQRIVLFNPMAERLFQCPAQEALGSPIDRFIPDRFRKTHGALVRRFSQSHVTSKRMGGQGTVNGLRTDGQEFPIEAALSQTTINGQTLYTVILRDISQRLQTETALKQSEERLRLALAAANQGLYDLNVQTGDCLISPEYARMLEYDPAEFHETHAAWLERLHPDDRERINRTYEDYIAGRRSDYRVEFRQRTKTGDWKWILSIGNLVARSADGKPLRMLGTHTDISLRKQSDLRIEAALHEKETLLREIHHRVKNNLQIISSLLYFQSNKAQQDTERTALRESQDRLRAMILVHELLYRSTDLNSIVLGEYLTALIDQLRRSLRDAISRVHLQIDTEDISVPAAIALPCGMIVTELITNACKYAYPDGTNGPITIRIAVNPGFFLLSVSDEGAGLPAEFNLSQAKSFGLQLVSNLADQLGATLTHQPGKGTSFILNVPLPAVPLTTEQVTAQPVTLEEGRS